MVDLENLKPLDRGLSESFEEVVCYLANLDKPMSTASFYRIDGSGGDGGVEAYWEMKDGNKIGYQAKYFPNRLTPSQWSQIDRSVLEALKNHPTLTKYVIAIPHDFTDFNGQRKKGEKQYWEEHKQRWELQVKKLKHTDVTFELWTKFELERRLCEDLEGVLNRFFRFVINPQWMQNSLQNSLNYLDNRFNPKDHVEIQAEELFSVMTRSKFFVDSLLSQYQGIELRGKKVLNQLKDILDFENDELVLELKQKLQKMPSLGMILNVSIEEDWRMEGVSVAIKELKFAIDKLIRKCVDESFLQIDKSYLFISKRRELESFNVDLANFEERINSSYMHAEQKRYAFLIGQAGVGKSHLLGKIAQSRLENNLPTGLVLGQRISCGLSLWKQLSGELGLPECLTKNQVLDLFNKIALKNNTRFLLLIDAINEGAGSRFWCDELANFLNDLLPFKRIVCVLSCRDVYEKILIPNKLKDSPKVYLEGFVTPQEQECAAKVYMDRRGIVRPSMPWLIPEFSNPLYLKTVCDSLKARGKAELPSGLQGSKNIFTFYRDSISDVICSQERINVDLRDALKDALTNIAEFMLEKRRDYCSIKETRELIRAEFQDFSKPKDGDWLQVLFSQGVLRKDPNPTEEDEDVVRFSYQRFQDFLMAIIAIEKIKDKPENLFAEGATLGFLRTHWSEWAGLIEMLFVLLPEYCQDVELYDVLPQIHNGLDNQILFYNEFSASLLSRSNKGFSEKTQTYFKNLEIFDQIIVLIRCACSGKHVWRDKLHIHLMGLKMAERDAKWTQQINHYQIDGLEQIVETIFSWARSGQKECVIYQSQFQIARQIVWFLTSSNRELRDRATKSLVCLFIESTSLFESILDEFKEIDDLYVLERILAAGYGAVCSKPEPDKLKRFSNAVWTVIFKEGNPPQHILLRDYALKIIEKANTNGLLSPDVNLLKCRPPYQSHLFRVVKESTVAKCVNDAGDDTINDSCIGSFGDFGLYVINPLLGKFTKKRILSNPDTLDGRNLSRFNMNDLKRWIVKKAYSYGWNKDRFPYDSSSYIDRSRPKIERIGKKYQWLALYELMSRLADNYLLCDEYSDESPRVYDSVEDLDYVRDLDPTNLPPLSINDDLSKTLLWAFEPTVKNEIVQDLYLEQWLYEVKDQCQGTLILRKDCEEQEWIVLYEFQQAFIDFETPHKSYGSKQQVEYRGLSTFVLNKNDINLFVEEMFSRKKIFYCQTFSPEVRGLYLKENRDSEECFLEYGGFQCIPLVSRYFWEQENDLDLKQSTFHFLPSRWLIEQLNLHVNPHNNAEWLNCENEVVFFEKIEDNRKVCLLNKKILSKLPLNFGLVSALIAERYICHPQEDGMWKHVYGFITNHDSQPREHVYEIKFL